MAKRFVVLVAVAATMLATVAPAFAPAFAREGQEGLVGPQPVEYSGEEATVTGLLWFEDFKYDGTPVWTMTDEASGTPYYVESGGPDLAAYEGQRVVAHGQVGHLEGNVLLVDHVESLGDEAEASFEEVEESTGAVGYQYESASAPPEKTVDPASETRQESGSVLAASLEPSITGAAPEAELADAELAAAKAPVATGIGTASHDTATDADSGEAGIFAGLELPNTGGVAVLVPLAGLLLASIGSLARRATR